MISIYLAGHIKETEYRKIISENELYNKYFEIIDPLVYENDLNKVVEVDKKLMDYCNILIAYIRVGSTFGTTSEIALMKCLYNKPVYVIDPTKKFRSNPWVKGHFDKVFDSILDCFSYLFEVYHGIKMEQITNKEENKMVEKNLNMGEEANKGFARDDSHTSTRLLDKNYSPMIVRKYQMYGWPLFVAIICDANLNDLDEVVYQIMDQAEKNGFIDGSIQGARNACGFLNDELVKYYNNIKKGVMEGLLIFWYQDKTGISAAYGDLMTHYKSVQEAYLIINTLPHI